MASILWQKPRHELLAILGRAAGSSCQVRSYFVGDAHQVLGLPRGAPASRVKEAFRRAALRTHPDTPTGSPDKFRQVQEAYKYLMEPTSKLAERLRSGSMSRNKGAATPSAGFEPWRRSAPLFADDLFRRVFGQDASTVLEEELKRSGVTHGVHGHAIREALFGELLQKARELDRQQRAAAAAAAAASGSSSSSKSSSSTTTASSSSSSGPRESTAEARERAKRDAGAWRPTGFKTDPNAPSVTRTRVRNAEGKWVVRITTTARGPDGKTRMDVREKPIYRM